MPSIAGEKWSTTRIWPAKNAAQARTYRSLGAMVKFSVTHSRYSPPTAMATLTHSKAVGRRFRNRPKRGTMTMYMAVMNPAFPAEVSASPSCWR